MQARSGAVGHGTRGYLALAYSILSVSLNGSQRTLARRCNLNSKHLRFHLESLEGRGLLERGRVPPSAKVKYRTTERGRK